MCFDSRLFLGVEGTLSVSHARQERRGQAVSWFPIWIACWSWASEALFFVGLGPQPLCPAVDSWSRAHELRRGSQCPGRARNVLGENRAKVLVSCSTDLEATVFLGGVDETTKA